MENENKLVYIMSPDEQYSQNQLNEEKDKLNSFVSNLSSSDKSSIYDTGLKLLKVQEAKEGI